MLVRELKDKKAVLVNYLIWIKRNIYEYKFMKLQLLTSLFWWIIEISMHKTFYVFRVTSHVRSASICKITQLPCVVCRINVAHFTNEETECMKKVEVEPYLRCLNSFFEYLTLYQCNHWNIPSKKLLTDILFWDWGLTTNTQRL